MCYDIAPPWSYYRPASIARSSPYGSGMSRVTSIQVYLHAHIALKEAALTRVQPFEQGKAARYQPDDRILAFLNAL
jgi:hypothetical protein